MNGYDARDTGSGSFIPNDPGAIAPTPESNGGPTGSGNGTGTYQPPAIPGSNQPRPPANTPVGAGSADTQNPNPPAVPPVLDPTPPQRKVEPINVAQDDRIQIACTGCRMGDLIRNAPPPSIGSLEELGRVLYNGMDTLTQPMQAGLSWVLNVNESNSGGAKDAPTTTTDGETKHWIYGPKDDRKINPDGSTAPNTWTTPDNYSDGKTATDKLDPFKPINGKRPVIIPDGTKVQNGRTPGGEGPYKGSGGGRETLIPGGLPPGSAGTWRPF